MEKKNLKLSIESSRKVFLSLGFLIVSALVTMALTYKVPISIKERMVVIHEIDIPEILVYDEVDDPIEIEPIIPDVKPLSPETSTTPIFSNDLLSDATTKANTDDNPVASLSSDTPIDPSVIKFEPIIGGGEFVEAPVVDFPDKEAIFEGGWNNYLGKELVYPAYSQSVGEQGKIYVDFVVEKDGSVTDVKIANPNSPKALQNEALRVVKKSPKWIPGSVQGEYVRSRMRVTINFKLH